MAGTLRKAMTYLGLAEDGSAAEEYYEEVDETMDDVAPVTPISRAASHMAAPAPTPDLRRICTEHPHDYNDAKAIGDAFREGTPVIMNLTDLTDAEAKRLVDFASGLVFGLRGTLERVTARVFLLSPEHVQVANDDQSSRPDSGFYDQSR